MSLLLEETEEWISPQEIGTVIHNDKAIWLPPGQPEPGYCIPMTTTDTNKSEENHQTCQPTLDMAFRVPTLTSIDSSVTGALKTSNASSTTAEVYDQRAAE